MPMLQVSDLHVTYQTPAGKAHAVNGVNLEVAAGETVGIVGESGCGKSSLARAVMRLLEPASGRIMIGDIDATALPKNKLRPLRRRIQMVFQDPAASLDPRFTVGRLIGEPLTLTEKNRAARDKRVRALMNDVGLPGELFDRYPHQLSGGQRQRVAIARAIAPGPDIIVLDEPVSALDVSLQAQVLNLLVDLQERYRLAYLFVSHDIGVVQYMADRIAVMYLGRIVEIAPYADMMELPLHPYTQALFQAVPIMDPHRSRIANKQILAGDVPSPLNIPPGCAFHTRCRFATDHCRRTEPQLHPAGPERFVACHLPSPAIENNNDLNDVSH
ncbi:MULTISPECIES: oligopeptide/dipeptide ABC transporter ATP-binding protein [unclassified Brenneria]|uniref:ABC transporter ATP-binding protein n=1 Tax=unclassified Brenneria TaxID=2634434 RepID=UPI0029C5C456|nr:MULTISPECIES: oligopeptide/dipeptide ABC transporter ATP-binding protein [unclassified Brenneria]MDX5630922.1 ATP-binding cassette domain-containing protein [Brenneria sp. L3-3Z]MDX5698004.1 ATP-binding cassette domain-containing protein [Brenneria sp. L4-2C]